MDSIEFWVDRWKRKPDASGAKPITYNAIQDRLTDLMEESLLKTKGKKVLDLGCGRGEILEWLVGVHGAIGTGIDVGAAPVRYLQSRRLVRAAQEDLRKFRDGENKYDIVLSCFTLQHMEDKDDILAFYETILAHLDRRGFVILIDKFGDDPQPMSFPRPLSFHEKIWENLRLREVDRRFLTKISTDPSKFVVTLKRKRPGWKNLFQEVNSGSIVGKENENPISPLLSVFEEDLLEPSSISSESIDSILPDGYLLEGMEEEKDLSEDVFSNQVREEDSMPSSIEDWEQM